MLPQSLLSGVCPIYFRHTNLLAEILLEERIDPLCLFIQLVLLI